MPSFFSNVSLGCTLLLHEVAPAAKEKLEEIIPGEMEGWLHINSR